MTMKSKEFLKVKDLKIDDSGDDLSAQEEEVCIKGYPSNKLSVKWFTCHKNSNFLKECVKRKSIDSSL